MNERRQILSPEQIDELAEHLGEVLLDAEELATAVFAIDMAANSCRKGAPTPSEWKELRETNHAHMLLVAARATKLRALLRADLPIGLRARPLWKTAGLDWERFDADLETIADSATAEAEWGAPQKGAGRPADESRDKLISVVHNIYAEGVRSKSRGSHFERTVEMVLGHLDREVEDVHSLIVNALRRQPEPPFRVHPRP